MKPSDVLARSMRTALTLLLLVLPLGALAQSAGWRVGVGAQVRDTAYIGASNDNVVLPLLQYEGERAYWRGLRLGWRAHDGEATTLSWILQARMDSISSKDLDGFDGLQRRQRSIDAGIAVEQVLGPWRLELSAVSDVLGRSRGQQLQTRLGYPLLMGHTRVVPEFGLGWWSSGLADYYYGLSAQENPLTGQAYRPGAVWLPELGVNVVHPLNRHWAITGSLRHRRLADALRDSPLVDGSSETSLLIGVSRGF